jgi:hypothetical protein
LPYSAQTVQSLWTEFRNRCKPEARNPLFQNNYLGHEPMRRLNSIIIVVILSFSAALQAQPDGPVYNKAASAYQSGDLIEAETLWIELADEGNADAQYALGIMHLKKEAQDSQDSKAFRYLVEAAKKQHVASMFNLGVAYWEGRGVIRQPEKALNWWEVAAQRDDAGAQFNLGLAYYIGEGRDQNTAKAIYWAQQAANNGHPQAQALLVTLRKKLNEDTKKAVQAVPLVPNTAVIARSQPEPRPAVSKKANKDNKIPVARAEKPNQIKLSKAQTILRAAPDERSIQVNILKAGTSIRVIKSVGEWSQIKITRSYPVWVYATFVKKLGNDVGEIKGSNVNIRPSASTNNLTSPPLGQMNNGDRVSIVQTSGPWLEILPQTPFPAWVKTVDIQ